MCGHIHRGAWIPWEDLSLANDGDGVGRLAVLAEELDGTLRPRSRNGEILTMLRRSGCRSAETLYCTGRRMACSQAWACPGQAGGTPLQINGARRDA